MHRLHIALAAASPSVKVKRKGLLKKATLKFEIPSRQQKLTRAKRPPNINLRKSTCVHDPERGEQYPWEGKIIVRGRQIGPNLSVGTYTII